jgi:polyhydroxyalkanoate synthase
LNAMRLAYTDWLLHAMQSPAQSVTLMLETVERVSRLTLNEMLSPENESVLLDVPEDHRFHDHAWNHWPYRLYRDLFIILHDLVTHSTRGIRGVSVHHRQVVNVSCHQWLDAFSPANWPWTHPLVINRTFQSHGMNLFNGALNLQEDIKQLLSEQEQREPDQFRIGQDVACTPGVVVNRNRLVELMQYEPMSTTVKRNPVLIVPAWIMKYYILDLSPHNSLVRYLVEKGHTVFMVSWINPTAEDRDLGMDDYLRMGVMESMDCIGKMTDRAPINAVGYCLGGTLLAIAAAAMGRDRDLRLESVTLLAAQTDFSEPGDLGLFIDESQVTLLEDSMWETGYLDNRQMAGSFRITQANERLWGTWVNDYLMGERQPLTDMAAWNLDSTRLPYRMHTEYLRHLYLNNDLAQGRYRVGTQPVSLSDIQCPIFCVGAERDTVAPWLSVYKIHLYARQDITFVLTSGGHNVGIVNPPGVPGRHYRITTRKASMPYVAPEDLNACVATHEGSWWHAWNDWLTAHSGGEVDAAQRAASESCPQTKGRAPGQYVMQR